jgi:hypothetical protein
VTLRSYLADKLGCDPMRITKKYTGASCLGKRVYHKETTSANAEAVERVQAELEALDLKFRSKMELLRKEKREHESTIDRMYISSPNIDAMFVPNHLNIGFGPSFHPASYLTLPMNAILMQGMAKDVLAFSKPDNVDAALTSGTGDEQDMRLAESKQSPRSSHPNEMNAYTARYGQAHNQVSNLMNPTQLAYIQMLAGCGPYVKTDADPSFSEFQAQQYKDSSSQSKSFAKNGSASTRSDTTDEEKADTYVHQQLTPYLLGRSLIVKTDNHNLIYLANSTIPKLVRWRVLLSEFQFSVVHIPGKENVVADGMKRVFRTEYATFNSLKRSVHVDDTIPRIFRLEGEDMTSSDEG